MGVGEGEGEGGRRKDIFVTSSLLPCIIKSFKKKKRSHCSISGENSWNILS